MEDEEPAGTREPGAVVISGGLSDARRGGGSSLGSSEDGVSLIRGRAPRADVRLLGAGELPPLASSLLERVGDSVEVSRSGSAGGSSAPDARVDRGFPWSSGDWPCKERPFAVLFVGAERFEPLPPDTPDVSGGGVPSVAATSKLGAERVVSVRDGLGCSEGPELAVVFGERRNW